MVHPGFTLQLARIRGLYAEGWALWLLPLGRKEGVIPGAHVAHPYRSIVAWVLSAAKKKGE